MCDNVHLNKDFNAWRPVAGVVWITKGVMLTVSHNAVLGVGIWQVSGVATRNFSLQCRVVKRNSKIMLMIIITLTFCAASATICP